MVIVDLAIGQTYTTSMPVDDGANDRSVPKIQTSVHWSSCNLKESSSWEYRNWRFWL